MGRRAGHISTRCLVTRTDIGYLPSSAPPRSCRRSASPGRKHYALLATLRKYLLPLSVEPALATNSFNRGAYAELFDAIMTCPTKSALIRKLQQKKPRRGKSGLLLLIPISVLWDPSRTLPESATDLYHLIGFASACLDRMDRCAEAGGHSATAAGCPRRLSCRAASDRAASPARAGVRSSAMPPRSGRPSLCI